MNIHTVAWIETLIPSETDHGRLIFRLKDLRGDHSSKTVKKTNEKVSLNGQQNIIQERNFLSAHSLNIDQFC